MQHVTRRRSLAFVLLTIMALAALSGCSALDQLVAGPTMTPLPPSGEPVEPPRPLADFTLLNQAGEPTRLSDLAGKPALFYFGYTHCPDICPLTLAEMSQVARILGESARQVHFVFVSVDIRRDTPERLAGFLPQFNPAFVGLTASDETALQTATNTFGVYYELEDVPETQAEYLVAHTASTFLVDAEGQLRMIFAYRTPPQIIAAELQRLLATPCVCAGKDRLPSL